MPSERREPAQATQQQTGHAAGRAAGAAQQTPEQREANAKQAYDKEAALPRPIAALDSVWIEELTYLEVRDAMKAGKTTALVFAGQHGAERSVPGGRQASVRDQARRRSRSRVSSATR